MLQAKFNRVPSEDIHLTRACNGVPTEPSLYAEIFERGIDPDVDNPEICHDHSEPPNTWPPLEEILSYQQRVRERITAQYVKKTAETDRKVGQALWIGFEHEGPPSGNLKYLVRLYSNVCL